MPGRSRIRGPSWPRSSPVARLSPPPAPQPWQAHASLPPWRRRRPPAPPLPRSPSPTPVSCASASRVTTSTAAWRSSPTRLSTRWWARASTRRRRSVRSGALGAALATPWSRTPTRQRSSSSSSSRRARAPASARGATATTLATTMWPCAATTTPPCTSTSPSSASPTTASRMSTPPTGATPPCPRPCCAAWTTSPPR